MPYRETEIRHGPPLRYVAEKIESAMMQAHFVHHMAHLVPGDVDLPDGYPDTFSVREDVVRSPSHGVFSDCLKAFLALYDRLEHHTPEVVERLLAARHENAKRLVWGMVKDADFTGSNWPASDNPTP